MKAKKIIKKWLNMAFNCGVILPPFQIAVEITEKCNLHCSGCPREMGVDNLDMSVTDFREIVGKFKHLQKLSFVGRGETFCHPHIRQILELCRGIHTVSITTNGTYFKDIHMLYLLEHMGNTELIISMGDEHKGHVDLDNLRKCNIPIIIQTMATPELDPEEIFETAEYIGAKKVNMYYPIGFDRNVNPQPVIVPKKKYKFEISVPPETPIREKCFDPMYFMRIAIDGTVYPCCYIYNSSDCWSETWYNTNLMPDQDFYKMGNILKQSAEEIWHSAKYNALRKEVFSIETGQQISCDNLNNLRVNLYDTRNFSYCEICLKRWGMAC